MKRSHRQLLSSLLAGLLLCSPFSTLALEANDNDISTYSTSSIDINALKASVEDLLRSIRVDNNGYGMDNVDFDHLGLGSEIPAYFLKDNIKPANAHYYPIVDSNSTVIAIATAVVTDSGELSCQLGKAFADELNNFLKTNNEVAFGFNNDETYFCSSNNIVPISVTTNGISQINEGNDYSSIMDFGKITSDVTLDVSISPSTRAGYYTSLAVPIISQENRPICWAAAMLSIAQYKTGSTNGYSAGTFADAVLLSHGDVGLNTAFVKPVFWYYFNLSTNTDYGTLNYSTLKSYINNGTPLYGDFWITPTNFSRHAVVIRGYNDSVTGANLGLFSYMDGNFKTYQTGTVPIDGSYYITLNGERYSLHASNRPV